MSKRGFTLVETIVVLSMISIASGILVLSFFSAHNDSVMEEAKMLTVKALEGARNRATSGIGDDSHGIRITTDNRIKYFTGNTFNEANVFRVIKLPSRVDNDSGDIDFVFRRISGELISGTQLIKLKSEITEVELVEIEVSESGSINIVNTE